jgi:hypothetical protein
MTQGCYAGGGEMAQGCGVGSTGRRGAAVQVARDATGEGWLQLGRDGRRRPLPPKTLWSLHE